MICVSSVSFLPLFMIISNLPITIRIPWSLARHRFFSTGVNKISLHAIETAAFMVILDDEAHEYDQVSYGLCI